MHVDHLIDIGLKSVCYLCITGFGETSLHNGKHRAKLEGVIDANEVDHLTLDA